MTARRTIVLPTCGGIPRVGSRRSHQRSQASFPRQGSNEMAPSAGAGLLAMTRAASTSSRLPTSLTPLRDRLLGPVVPLGGRVDHSMSRGSEAAIPHPTLAFRSLWRVEALATRLGSMPKPAPLSNHQWEPRGLWVTLKPVQMTLGRSPRAEPNRLVRMRGLEPPRAFAHTDLNRARLPIPPHPRGTTSLASPRRG
jgi:hypothetical protein